MAETITLELPDTIFMPAKRMAKATKRSIDDVLLGALRTSLPSLDGLSPSLIDELTCLEELDDDSLRKVMLDELPTKTQQKLHRLLQKNKSGNLTEAERKNLDTLQSKADQFMLRKARAAVLLRFRGRRLPTLSELRQFSKSQST